MKNIKVEKSRPPIYLSNTFKKKFNKYLKNPSAVGKNTKNYFDSFLLKKASMLFKYIDKENPFITASFNFDEVFYLLFKSCFWFTDIDYKKIKLLSEEFQCALLAIEIDAVGINEEGLRLELSDARRYRKILSKHIYKDSFKEIWCQYAKLGLFPFVQDRGDVWCHDFDDKSLFFKHLPEILKINGGPECTNLINLRNYHFKMWQDEEFVMILAHDNLENLKHGPPSFHENKELMIKILEKYPDYYFNMKKRSLKKSHVITRTVITAKPSLIDKIPRQYISGLNPFILAQATNNDKEKLDKYSSNYKGLVCITGQLKSLSTKKEAKKLLENHGYAVSRNLTQECDFLVSESDVVTSKLKAVRNTDYFNSYKHIKVIKFINELLE